MAQLTKDMNIILENPTRIITIMVKFRARHAYETTDSTS